MTVGSNRAKHDARIDDLLGQIEHQKYMIILLGPNTQADPDLLYQRSLREQKLSRARRDLHELIVPGAKTDRIDSQIRAGIRKLEKRLHITPKDKNPSKYAHIERLLASAHQRHRKLTDRQSTDELKRLAGTLGENLSSNYQSLVERIEDEVTELKSAIASATEAVGEAKSNGASHLPVLEAQLANLTDQLTKREKKLSTARECAERYAGKDAPRARTAAQDKAANDPEPQARIERKKLAVGRPTKLERVGNRLELKKSEYSKATAAEQAAKRKVHEEIQTNSPENILALIAEAERLERRSAALGQELENIRAEYKEEQTKAKEREAKISQRQEEKAQRKLAKENRKQAHDDQQQPPRPSKKTAKRLARTNPAVAATTEPDSESKPRLSRLARRAAKTLLREEMEPDMPAKKPAKPKKSTSPVSVPETQPGSENTQPTENPETPATSEQLTRLQNLFQKKKLPVPRKRAEAGASGNGSSATQRTSQEDLLKELLARQRAAREAAARADGEDSYQQWVAQEEARRTSIGPARW